MSQKAEYVEILEKIGRNVLLYQQFEQLLKALVSNSSIKLRQSDTETNLEAYKDKFHKLTLGNLVGLYLENNNPNKKTTDDEFVNEITFSMDFRIGYDSKYFGFKKEKLQEIVDQRNKLIHHSLEYFEPESKQKCIEFSKQLDEQCKIIKNEINELKNIIKAYMVLRKDVSGYISSESFMDSVRCPDKVITNLVNIASNTNRPDGWTCLSQAGQNLHDNSLKDISFVKYQYESLKKFIIETGFFDIRNEQSQTGSNRTLYRVKKGFSLSAWQC